MPNVLTTQTGGQLRAASQFDLSPQNFDQALTFSKYLADSDLVPKDFKGKPGNCLIAMQWGAELGLKPLQSLQNLAVINGRPALWGDAVIALVLASPVCEYVNEDDDGQTAYCRVKRKGGVEQVRSFSMEDAQRAGLTGKQGPWMQYPKRMRQMRARAFALRDVFPDVLRGMPVAEELQDMANAAPQPGERHMGEAEVVQPEWPADRWAAGLPKWADGIVKGKPIADVLAWLGSKGKVTAEQEQQLRDEVVRRQGASAAPAGAAANAADPATDADGVLVVDAAKLEQDLRGAADLDALYKHGSLLDAVEDLAERQRLTEIFEARMAELEG
ncbi:recombinase RecT [Delftia acidovorans]|uniref:recombinase RecT n=1 Tax=Delftia acidovorans TaxID=80866 RepID=UPI0028A70F7C|nr:recombinase RecT [Delftia acidovorans]